MRKTGICAAVVAASLLTALPEPASSQEYTFRTSTIAPMTEVYNQDLAQPFAEYVDVLTDGRVKFEIFEGGVLAPIFKVHESVQDGVADAGIAPASFLGTKDPTNAMIQGIPTGLGVDSFLAWVYFGGGKELLAEHRRETMGVHSIPLGAGPSEFFAHSHEAITSVDQLKDKKYRTLGNWAAIVEDQFDASPTVVPGAEVYGMLEKHAIDLAEYSMPSQNTAIGLHEVAPYIIYPGIHAPAWGFELVIKTERWDALPEDLQRKIELAAKLATYDSMNRIILKDLDALVELEQADVEFVRLPEEFKEASRVAARTWAMNAAAEAEKEGNPWPGRVAESIFEFQDKWRTYSGYMVIDHTDSISKSD